MHVQNRNTLLRLTHMNKKQIVMNVMERGRIELLKSGRSKEVDGERRRQTKDSIPLRGRRDSSRNEPNRQGILMKVERRGRRKKKCQQNQ